MHVLSTIFFRYLEFCEDKLQRDEQSLQVKYPSASWDSLSWSYWLIKDLQIDYSLYLKKNIKNSTKKSKIINLMLDKISKNSFSWHYDTTRKYYLYQLLKEQKKSKAVLIPEVGPCGFDLLIALACGYKEFIVYDANQDFLDSLSYIWKENISKITIIKSTTEEFNFKEYKDIDIIAPDWSHDDLLGKIKHFKSIITYSNPSDHSQHKKKIKKNEIDNFFDSLKDLRC
jgi:hypothetical protein